MKKRSLILSLAALTACLGSACLLGGVASGFIDNGPILAKAAVGDSVKIGEGTYKEIYRTGFENATASSSYKNVTTNVAADSADGLAWTIGNGCISTTGKITGNNSAHMKLYSDNVSGYLMNTTVLSDSVDAVQFKYASDKKSVSFRVDCSSDGESWTELGSVTTQSGSESGTLDYELSSSVSDFRLRIMVTGGFPTGASTNYRLIIDDIVFAKKEATPSISIDGESDISVGVGASANLPLKSSNLPEGASITASTENNEVATISISEGNDSLIITGVAEGTTTYTVSVKNGDTIVASCTGNIVVTGVSVTSDAFKNGDVLKLGKSYQLSASVSPAGSSQEVTWSSSSAAATVDENGLLRIVGNCDEKITITATSAVDATKSGTISFTIDDAYEVSISDLLTNDGTTFANSLVAGTKVTTKGTITTFDGTSAYIQSGEAAVFVSTTSDKYFSELKVGDGVKVTGAVKIDNGLVKIVPASADSDDAAKEEVVPLELNVDSLVGANTSRLVKATKAICLEDKAISSAAGATKAKFKFEGSESSSAEFVAYIAKDDLKTLYGVYGDFEEGAAYNLSGIFYRYVSGTNDESRFVLGSSFGAYENEDLRGFIATYITEQSKKEEGSATCASKYSAASEALSKLSEATQNTFKTASAYKDAYEVYSYWESHKDAKSTAGLVSHASASDWRNNLVAITGSILLVGGATFFFAYNGKKKKDR